MDDATLLDKLAEYHKTHNLTQAELANLLSAEAYIACRPVKLPRAGNKKIIKSILKSPSGVNINETEQSKK